MRTASQIALVLIGGGALGYGVAASMDIDRACREARARGDPNAASICSTSWSSHGHWYGGTGSWRLASLERVVRGGFGHAGLHFGFHG